MEPSKTDTSPTGTIADTANRLALWARRAPGGVARVEFVSEDARQAVLGRLRQALAVEGQELRELTFPEGLDAPQLVERFVQEIAGLPKGSTVSVSGFEHALPVGTALPDALRIFNFNRERLFRDGIRQVWWVPPHLAGQMVLVSPDLDSWILVRLRLEEVPPRTEQLGDRVGERDEYAAAPDDARTRAASLFRRFEQGIAEARPTVALLEDLLLPATRALREAGLDAEAADLAARADALLLARRPVAAEPEPALDFFISYTRSDERWAEWIAWELKEEGYTVRLMAWDFVPGSNFVLEMHKASAEARRTIAVLSPAYLRSAFSAAEWAAAFRQDPTGEERRLIPVRVAECDPPGLLGSIVHLDLHGVADEDEARRRLLAAIRGRAGAPPERPAFPGAGAAAATSPLARPAYPGALPAVWTVPHPRNPYLTGRDPLLAEARAHLEGRRHVAVAIHGLGGVGKTQLAVAYAYRYSADYDAVLWVSAATGPAVAANLAGLAASLGLSEAGAREQAVATEAVLRWLREKRRWLLVFDGADSREAARAVSVALPPMPGGHVLVTSRLAEWPLAIAGVEVRVLPEDDACDFLVARTESFAGVGASEEARAVARELGGLPLALEQAASYVLRHRVTFHEYRRRLETSRSRLLAETSAGATSYPRALAETWLVTESALTAPARTVLRLASFLALAEIPRALFTEGKPEVAAGVRALSEEGGEPGRQQDEGDVEAALVELAGYSLIDLGAVTFGCHRLVQAVQADRVPEGSRRRWVELALRMVDRHGPVEADDIRTWPVWDLLRPHAEAVVAAAEGMGITDLMAEVLGKLAGYLKGHALFSEAEPLMRRALRIAERTFGADNPSVATRLNNLAQLLQDTNRLTEAEPLMRRALEIYERRFGPEHPNVAATLNDLALLLKTSNRLAEAEPLMRRALAIAERRFGPEHPEVATDLNNLAQLLKATNRLAEAEPLMRRALAIAERSFDPEHPHVATSLNNLARLLQVTNRLAEAEPLMRRALAIDERSFGPEHFKVAIRLSNLAALLQDTNRLVEAEPLILRALAIDERSFGPEHPNVAIRLNNLALLLKATNRLAEAEPLMRRALAIDERSFGPEHPNVARDLSNLAQLLQDTHRLAEAEPLQRRAVEILRRFAEVNGHQHIEMRAAAANYESILRAMGLPPAEVERNLREAAGTLSKQE